MSGAEGGPSPGAETNVVTVRLAGEEHVLRSAADPEHTRLCARTLDDRIAEIREHAPGVSVQRAAILAGLSLADEVLRLRGELVRAQLDAAERADALARRIEAALAEGGGESPTPPGEGGSRSG